MNRVYVNDIFNYKRSTKYALRQKSIKYKTQSNPLLLMKTKVSAAGIKGVPVPVSKLEAYDYRERIHSTF